MADQAVQTVARKILYILVAEQRLRIGEGISPQSLGKDLERHGISAADQPAGIALALSNGWLQKGPEEELQLTDKGFDIDFGQ